MKNHLSRHKILSPVMSKYATKNNNRSDEKCTRECALLLGGAFCRQEMIDGSLAVDTWMEEILKTC